MYGRTYQPEDFDVLSFPDKAALGSRDYDSIAQDFIGRGLESACWVGLRFPADCQDLITRMHTDNLLSRNGRGFYMLTDSALEKLFVAYPIGNNLRTLLQPLHEVFTSRGYEGDILG
jgi:hypothetical protein